MHLTGNTKSQRARKDSNAIDPLTLVLRLREQAYALNDRDGDSLSTLLRDAQHRALLIEAARERTALRSVRPPTVRWLTGPTPLMRPASARVALHHRS